MILLVGFGRMVMVKYNEIQLMDEIPNNHLVCLKPRIIVGINYLPTGVRRISEPSTVPNALGTIVRKLPRAPNVHRPKRLKSQTRKAQMILPSMKLIAIGLGS